MKKIIFFDIDGTLTSEIDSQIPTSCTNAIRKARENGHYMYINSGRCAHNIGKRFLEIGFDGMICGCGTNIFSAKTELFYIGQTHEMTMQILDWARKTDVDILFEGRDELCFDTVRPLKHPMANKMLRSFRDIKKFPMRATPEEFDFTCDKFVIWYETREQLKKFRNESDKYFSFIDRGNNFAEFVPLGYSKATGIDYILQYHKIPMEQAYAIGDSSNDLPMLKAVPNSIAMGNASPASLFEEVSFVTQKASEDGIYHALEHFGFL